MKLVFDSSVLSCFARADLLDLLEQLTRKHERLVPRAVLGEIKNGVAKYPQLEAIEECTWLKVVAVDSLEELVAFAEYARRLDAGLRNIGESSVLAWAEVHGGVALIDDQDAVQCAKERSVRVSRTLAIVATGLATKLLDEARAADVVQALIERGGARFPCDGSGFVTWVRTSGFF
jgi:predicted nucleic acid-binding protein